MKKYLLIALGTICLVDLADQSITPAHADVLCQKSGKTVQRFAGSTCPRRWRLIIDTSAFVGPAGTNGSNGADGADGSLRIYGDGSDGALTVTSNTTLSTPLAQYTDVTINSGITLSVMSGTTIRCTGTFTNNGTIFVYGGAYGATAESGQGTPSVVTIRAARPPGIGIADALPQHGEFGPNTVNLFGGVGGQALHLNSLRALLNPGPLGGSGGGASGGYGEGGIGGGTLRVLCRGGITISGSGIISAAGSTSGEGGGGGGGGVVILASPTSITHAGSISVVGGAGGNSSDQSGAGGGGGGGLVHLISPVVNSSGAISISGGVAGATTVAVTNSVRSGGSGGGASAGNGGTGANVLSTNTQSSQSSGSVGQSITTLADPTGLF